MNPADSNCGISPHQWRIRHRGPPPPPPWDQSGLSTRVRLLDANSDYVIGPPAGEEKVFLLPIEVDKKTVGWLSLSPFKLPRSELEKKFRSEQLLALYPIAAGSLVLALLIGILMGRHLIRPVKSLAKAAHDMAGGKLEARVENNSRDELGQLSRDFNHLAETLERNELMRRRSMADISHELRTPISILRGGIEAMQDGIHPLDLKYLNRLHSNLMSLNQLVDDLYDLALFDAGALNYNMLSFDLSEELLTVAEANEVKFRDHGLRFRYDITPDLIIAGDDRRIRQVINNLLKNSRRYTDSGGEVVFHAYRQNEHIVIELNDAAPGVEPEKLQLLFDRFYRVESSRSRAGGGAGLGLAISRSMVEAHQGSIEAAASELGGLKITIKLPAESE